MHCSLTSVVMNSSTLVLTTSPFLSSCIFLRYMTLMTMLSPRNIFPLFPSYSLLLVLLFYPPVLISIMSILPMKYCILKCVFNGCCYFSPKKTQGDLTHSNYIPLFYISIWIVPKFNFRLNCLVLNKPIQAVHRHILLLKIYCFTSS